MSKIDRALAERKKRALREEGLTQAKMDIAAAISMLISECDWMVDIAGNRVMGPDDWEFRYADMRFVKHD